MQGIFKDCAQTCLYYKVAYEEAVAMLEQLLLVTYYSSPNSLFYARLASYWLLFTDYWPL